MNGRGNRDPEPRTGSDSPPSRKRGLRLSIGLLAAILVPVCAGLVAVGAWFLIGKSGTLAGFEEAEGGVLVPAAADGTAAIAEIVIGAGGNEITLRRTDGGWVLADAGAYPVESSRVETALEELGNLRAAYVSRGDSTTVRGYGFSDRSNFSPGPVKVTLRSSEGAVLERLWLGDAVIVPGEIEPTSVAIKLKDDPRIWLASGTPRFSANPTDWVDQRIIHVPRDNVLGLIITAPDGKRLAIRRSRDAGGLEVAEGLSPSESIKGPWVLRGIARVLENLEFEAVRKAETVRENGGTWRARVRTADGILVTIRLLTGGDSAWAKFEAEPTGGQDAPRERARKFNDRHGQWAYRLPTFAESTLMTRPADLTAEEEAGTAPAPSPQ